MNRMNPSTLFPEDRSLPAMFLRISTRMGPGKFIWNRHMGGWIGISYGEVAKEVRHIASGLLARGVNAGDRVIINSENRLEWVIADLAIMSIGAVTVPAYTSYTIDDHLHLINDSGAVAIICSTRKLASVAEVAAEQAPSCRLLVLIESSKTIHQPAGLAIISWDNLIADGKRFPADIDAMISTLEPDNLACIIYTSGSDDQPKGVMLSHRSILGNITAARERFPMVREGREVFLSLLPLSHAYEHTIGLYFAILVAAEIYHLPTPEHIAQALREARPTMMTAVPRLCELLHDRIRSSAKGRGRMAENLLALTLRLGRKKEQKDRLSPGEMLLDLFLTVLVRRAVARQLGGRLRIIVSGGAALSPAVGRFFLALGIRLVQGYGQTEASPVISSNGTDDIRIQSVGRPLEGVEVRRSKSGELLVRGPLVMQGYWGQPEETAKVLKDGWLHTGDIAEIDGDGFITITGRKKDIIVNSGGENVSPGRVESRLLAQPYIEQAMVFGDRRPWLVAVVVPSQLCLDHAAKKPDKITKYIQSDIDTANSRLAASERVRRFIIDRDGFTIDNKRLTPTLKPRRHIIWRDFEDRLNQLYSRQN
ncbi:long-chain fatty acid--CoA ligase [Alphaproteobacteria bacterium LSUCC0684]